MTVSNGVPTGNIRMRDVAAHAGVSPATVSNYLNNPHKLTDATRERIHAAIQTLGWVPNYAARQLRAGRNDTLGFVTFELTNAQSIEIGSGIERRVSERGMYLLTANTNGSSDRERAYLDMFEMQRVSGVIIGPIGDIDEHLEQMRQRGTPSVLNGRRSSNPRQPYVAIDDVRGGELAVEHLISVGCRHIAFVGSSPDLRQISDRLRGALRAAERVPGVGIEVIGSRDRTIRDGAAAAEDLLARPRNRWPDGIFCANDLLAIGMMQVLLQAGGVRIPQDLAVVGYDDIDFAATTLIPLTSVRVSHDELGEAVAEVMFSEITRMASGSTSPLPGHQIEGVPTLVVRESTRRE